MNFYFCITLVAEEILNNHMVATTVDFRMLVIVQRITHYTKAYQQERFRTKRLSFIRALYLNEMLRHGKLIYYAGSNTTGSMTRSEHITISKNWIISQRSKLHGIVKMSKVLNLESGCGSTLEAKPPLNLRLRSGL